MSDMSESHYKGYWMVTNRCNLRCTYCVLENAYHQLKAELDLNGKKELLSHLYNKLGFRRLTLSGGEVLLIGKRPPSDFIELLQHIRQFRSEDPSKNLGIEIYTNGTYLDDNVAAEMEGVVDLVAVTIDSTSNDFLTSIGRNTKKFHDYYRNIVEVCRRLSQRGIKLKLHSVVSQKNHLILPDEVSPILDAVEEASGPLSCWKFYQYMSYDDVERDSKHAISEEAYHTFKERVETALAGRHVPLHFKDNEEMNASLFNILSYGTAQYMRPGDSWSTSQRTGDLRSYSSMEELFAKHDIEQSLYRRFHEVC
jgi:molybdenum cofactor biosynthesis enzyme MoaA